MIRKLIFSSIAILMGSATVLAADSEKDSYFGIKAGFDVNIPGKWHYDDGSVKMYRNGYGFNIGGVYNAWLGKGFYLEPGISLYYDSYSVYEVYTSDGLQSDKDPSLYKVGLRIPVVAGYEFSITDKYSMTIFTGPELNYSFSGKYKVEDKELWGDLVDSLFDSNRRIDCAWKVGVGFPVNNFTLSFEGDIGMTNLMKSSNIKFRENRFTIGLAYYFK